MVIIRCNPCECSYVALGCGVPFREDVLAVFRDGVAAIGVNEQDAIARCGPGCAVLQTIASGVGEVCGLGEFGDLDTGAVEIEDDGKEILQELADGTNSIANKVDGLIGKLAND